MTVFRIADTFTDSLAKLTGDEQKAVKTTAFDLQVNPANPGLSFHKLDKAKDKNFWSVRVNKDMRLIVHKMPGSLMLCYVDHHDAAYAWAERRKLEVHPTTGAAQLVEVRERFEEITIPVYVAAEPRSVVKPPLFATAADQLLLSFGVPSEWLAEVRTATEDTIFTIADHLPQEAAEALLNLATGSVPSPVVAPAPVTTTVDPFAHPDALRRFRIISGSEELERAFEFPWDKWTIFLHPAQRDVVERQFSGPARVSGAAGTGKTIVALHRAVNLARTNPDSRVLLTTFSEPLANALRVRLRRLLSAEPRLGERIDVEALDAVAIRLHERNIGKVKLASTAHVQQLLEHARSDAVAKFRSAFLLSEWEQIVDAWRLSSWADYKDVARIGRRTRLPEKARAALWQVFESVISALQRDGQRTLAGVYESLADHFGKAKQRPYQFIVVDEAQDLSVQQLRMLSALTGDESNGLFFAGDLGQRIFQSPFSWKQVGVDIRGRSSTLRINYRTSHQIRAQADRLLDIESADVDGNVERRTSISAFNGPTPNIQSFADRAAEVTAIAAWLSDRTTEGIRPGEIGLFVRSDAQLERGRAALEKAGLPFRVLDGRADAPSSAASLSTMHLAKGLEFRAVAVMACDDDVIPLEERIEGVGEPAELEEVYNAERRLLYVACTRAREHLMVSGVAPVSEFVDDLTAVI